MMQEPIHNRIDVCRVCGESSAFVFSLPVFGNPVAYYECKGCRYLQTQKPYWLERAYKYAINDVDTGIMWRNQTNVGRVIMTLLAYGMLDGRVIDHAGGYGILVRLLRDAGVDASWRDKYCENLLARGFEAAETSFDLLTAFEVLEHLADPVGELEHMLAVAPVVLVTTDLIPTQQTPPTSWWYLGPEHGQHIGFFRVPTLQNIATRLRCSLASDGHSVHIFSRTRVPRLWGALQRAKAISPLLKHFRLHSRIGSDFELVKLKRLAQAETIDVNGPGVAQSSKSHND
jgi:hypothetical protein